MTNKNTHIQAPAADVRIAQLETTNAALREALSSKNAHIAMLEEKILKMSVELASSRAREDEQNLMLRLSQTSQVTMADDFDSGNNVAATIDDSIKSVRGAHSASFTSTQSRFSFMPNWGSSRTLQTTDEMMEMEESGPFAGSSSGGLISGGGGGKGGLIGNMIQLDRNGNYDDLRVNFPVHRGRRRSSMQDESMMAPSTSTTTTANSPSLDQRRKSMVGQLFRLGKSDRSMGEGSAESQQQQQYQQQQQRRKPNRSKIILEVQTSSQTSNGLISSTVAFPSEDDDTLLGFE